MGIHICTMDTELIGTGMTREDLQFKHWCPYCDEITIWQAYIWGDERQCLECERFLTADDFPKGLEPKTGELIKESEP